MKVLITGGLGGIGRHLSYLLMKTGFDVTIMQRYPTQSIKYARWFPKDKLVWGDVRDFSKFRDLLVQQDAVIHLAYALPPDTEKHPEATHKINVGGTRDLIQILEEVNPKCRLLFPSSVMIYDPISNPERLITVTTSQNKSRHS
jgi:nucleoside-diphosphate-sugar epimerase